MGLWKNFKNWLGITDEPKPKYEPKPENSLVDLVQKEIDNMKEELKKEPNGDGNPRISGK